MSRFAQYYAKNVKRYYEGLRRDYIQPHQGA